jgi:peroxiredoxin
MRRLTIRRALGCLALGMVFPVGLSAQEPVRAFAMGDPLPGSAAPAFVLPYARAEGPGPEDQPFALRAELGRVVVLAFSPQPADSASVQLLRSFATRFESLFVGDVVVAVVTPLNPQAGVEMANNLGLQYKVLSDPSGRVRRMFGVDQRGLGVYVITSSGRISWRDIKLNPYRETTYDGIGAAVRDAWPQEPKQ